MINDKYAILARSIRSWGQDLGFSDVRISDIDLSAHEAGLAAWLEAGFHGEMDYMAAHGMKRARPAELVPNAVRAIVVRMDYLAPSTSPNWRAAESARGQLSDQAVISVYARGRDYHKVLRNRLQQLAQKIEAEVGQFGYRAFTDSAPVMEVALAEKAGLGWRGKHTCYSIAKLGQRFFWAKSLPICPYRLTLQLATIAAIALHA